MKKTIALIAAVLFTSCGVQKQETTADTAVQATGVVTETAAVSEILQETAVKAETTSAPVTTQITAEITEPEPEPVPLTRMSTSEGIELDPDSAPCDQETSFSYQDDKGKAFLLKRFDDNTAVYGVFSYDERTNDYGDSFPVERIVIQHDGIIDDMECTWTSRWCGAPQTLEQADIDNDGKNEIIMINYVMGGTMCFVNDLTVFDLKDGKYCDHRAWFDDNMELFRNAFAYEVDTTDKKVIINTDSGKYYQVYGDTADMIQMFEEPVDLTDVSLIDVVGFDLDNGKLSGSFTAGGKTDESFMPVIYIDFEFDVKFDGEKLTFENYHLSGYDYQLRRSRTDDMNVEYTLASHDRKTDNYTEIVSGSAFLPKDDTDPDRYTALSLYEYNIMGQECICLAHSAMNLMYFDYYTMLDGTPVHLAENYGTSLYDEVEWTGVRGYPNVKEYDINGDGQTELITGNMSGDGVRSVYVFTIKDGKPYAANLEENVVIKGTPANGLAGIPDISFKDDPSSAGDIIFNVRYCTEEGEKNADGSCKAVEEELKLSDIKMSDLKFYEFK